MKFNNVQNNVFFFVFIGVAWEIQQADSYDFWNILRPRNLKKRFFIRTKPCHITYDGNHDVCGTDGDSYINRSELQCAQEREYGKRVNLQLNHIGLCWRWERYGLSTSTFCLVSKLPVGSNSIE